MAATAARKPESTSTFGPAPSKMEVERAMAYLQRLVKGEAGFGTEALSPDSKVLLKSGRARFHSALDMLRKEPAVENLVVNISSDKAFWNAIMENEAVQDFQSLIAEERETQLQMQGGTDLGTVILGWIQEMITRSKIRESIEKIGATLVEFFVPKQKDKPTSELTDLVEEKIKSSFLLSVVVVFIVVVTRINGC